MSTNVWYGGKYIKKRFKNSHIAQEIQLSKQNILEIS